MKDNAPTAVQAGMTNELVGSRLPNMVLCD